MLYFKWGKAETNKPKETPQVSILRETRRATLISLPVGEVQTIPQERMSILEPRGFYIDRNQSAVLYSYSTIVDLNARESDFDPKQMRRIIVFWCLTEKGNIVKVRKDVEEPNLAWAIISDTAEMNKEYFSINKEDMLYDVYKKDEELC